MNLQIQHQNPWHDYCGGADHHTLPEAAECLRAGDEESHIVIVPLKGLIELLMRLVLVGYKEEDLLNFLKLEDL